MFLSIGQEITAKVVEFNKEDKKISLSIKAMEAPENEKPKLLMKKHLMKMLNKLSDC